VTSAPGKVMLLGEYAVLEGARAIAAAVNRRAKGKLVAARTPEQYSEVVKVVVARAGRAGFGIDGGIAIDSSAFYDEAGRKMGLGSSAAVAVVAASLVTGLGDETVLQIAIDAHREAAGGEGSGVDVAACFYGGVIAARRQPSPVIPLASRLRSVRMSLLFTGKSASTAELTARCRASAKWGEWTAIMQKLAEEGIRAWEGQNELAFLSVVARYGRAMQGLGADAGVEIVTEEIEAIMRLAEEGRAAAKPSGAGGGDVVVMFGFDEELPARIAERTGARLLDVAIDQRGLARKVSG
jgi:phosphomevalonate kinase